MTGAEEAFDGFWGRLGHHSTILALLVSPSRLFLSWDLEPVWLARIARHYREAGWDGTAYARALGSHGEEVSLRLAAADLHSCYLEISPAFSPRRVEWGLYWSDVRRLAILTRDLDGSAGVFGESVAAGGVEAGCMPGETFSDFDGYGPGRRFGDGA